MSDSGGSREHPSPHRARISTAVLLVALAVGPAAWALQQMLGYGVSSHACFPSDAPIAPAPAAWAADLPVIGMAGLAFFLIAFGGVAIAARAWRATREEKEGDRHVLLDVGEGRSRFLALCGVMAGCLFCLAILSDLAVTLGLRTCGSLLS